jgi:hypothetical protein
MSYRVEFLAQDRSAGTIASALDQARFPIFLHAVAAARSEVMQWEEAPSAQVVVNIFDLRDQLASRLQLAVPMNDPTAR